MNKLRVRFFSTLKTRFGREEMDLELPSPRQARDVFLDLFEQSDEAERFLGFVRFAVNREYARPDTMVNAGDELAIIPPVSGG